MVCCKVGNHTGVWEVNITVTCIRFGANIVQCHYATCTGQLGIVFCTMIFQNGISSMEIHLNRSLGHAFERIVIGIRIWIWIGIGVRIGIGIGIGIGLFGRCWVVIVAAARSETHCQGCC